MTNYLHNFDIPRLSTIIIEATVREDDVTKEAIFYAFLAIH